MTCLLTVHLVDEVSHTLRCPRAKALANLSIASAHGYAHGIMSGGYGLGGGEGGRGGRTGRAGEGAAGREGKGTERERAQGGKGHREGKGTRHGEVWIPE